MMLLFVPEEELAEISVGLINIFFLTTKEFFSIFLKWICRGDSR